MSKDIRTNGLLLDLTNSELFTISQTDKDKKFIETQMNFYKTKKQINEILTKLFPSIEWNIRQNDLSSKRPILFFFANGKYVFSMSGMRRLSTYTDKHLKKNIPYYLMKYGVILPVCKLKKIEIMNSAKI